MKTDCRGGGDSDGAGELTRDIANWRGGQAIC